MMKTTTYRTATKKFFAVALIFCVLVLLFALAGTNAPTTYAATLVVENENDSGAGSLRDVIADAQDGDIITFAPGVTHITLLSPIEIHEAVTINGGVDAGGNPMVTISGGGSTNIFLYFSIDVFSLVGLSLIDGYIDGGPGGAIKTHSSGSVSAKNCVFEGNSAEIGGAIYVESSAHDVTLVDCTFINNVSEYDVGGAIYINVWGGDVTLTGCTFTNNIAEGSGSAVYISGGNGDDQNDVTLTDCTFTGNISNGWGDGGTIVIYCGGYLTVTDCTFTDNATEGDGSSVLYIMGNQDAVILTDCTFTGNYGLGSYPTNIILISGGNIPGSNISVTADGCTFSDNDGGLYMYDISGDITLTDCTFTGNNNRAITGGPDGDFNITNCLFEDNIARHSGGALSIWAENNLTITNSTFINNRTLYDGSSGGGGAIDGGANGDFTIIGCTFTDNKSILDGGAINGGVGFYGTGSFMLIDCVFEGNSSNYGGGAISTGDAILKNCVFKDNAVSGDLAPDRHGYFSSPSFSDGGAIISDGSLLLEDCAFVGNTANGRGGAIEAVGSIVAINTSFLNNTTKNIERRVFKVELRDLTYQEVMALTPEELAEYLEEIVYHDDPSGAIDVSNYDNGMIGDNDFGVLYMFQCTVAANTGGGLYGYYEYGWDWPDNRETALFYAYNSIITGNTEMDGTTEANITLGELAGTGVNLTENGTDNLYDDIFGTNPITNFVYPLGLSTNITDKLTAADIDASVLTEVLGLTGYTEAQFMALLDADQLGVARDTDGNIVTFGAVEIGALSATTYTTTYNANWPGGVAGTGSAPTDSGEYEQGDAVTVLGAGTMSKAGYAFLGWSTTNNATTPTYAVDGTTISPSTFNMPDDEVELFGVWKQVSGVENFEKTAADAKFKAGETMDYTISFDLPDDLSTYKEICVEDIFDSTALEYNSVVSATVGGGNLSPTVDDTAKLTGKVSFTWTAAQLAGREGQTVVVVVRFTVGAAADGNITNNVNLYITPKNGVKPTIPDDTDNETVIPSIGAATKQAGNTNYVAGGTMDYTISFALPDDVSGYGSIRIEDIFDPAKLSYASVVSAKIGSSTITPSINTTQLASGKVSFTVSAAQLAGNGGKTVTLVVRCNVNSGADDIIMNTVNIYVTPLGKTEPLIPDKTARETVAKQSETRISTSYQVEYYYDGIKDAGKTYIGTGFVGDTVSDYPSQLKSGYKLNRTENLPLVLTATAADNVIKVYYVSATSPETFTKVPSNAKVKAGDNVDYTLSGIGNPYGAVVTDLRITDFPPVGLTFVKGSIPAFKNGDGLTYKILYSTNLRGETVLYSGLDATIAFSFKAPTLGSGEYITSIVVAFDSVPVGFGNGNKIVYTFKVTATEAGTKLVNKGSVSFRLQGLLVEYPSEGSVTVNGVPQTGDYTGLQAFAAMNISAAVVLAFVARRRRQKNTNAGI